MIVIPNSSAAVQLSHIYFHQVAANQSHCPPPEQQLSGHGYLAAMRPMEKSTRGQEERSTRVRQSTGTVMAENYTNTVTAPGMVIGG